MGPIAQTDGHDAPGLIDELVPGGAAMIDDVIGGCEHAIGEPVVAQELPGVFGRVQLGRFRRQQHDADIAGNAQLVRGVPSGLIDEQDGMGVVGDRLRSARRRARQRG